VTRSTSCSVPPPNPRNRRNVPSPAADGTLPRYRHYRRLSGLLTLSAGFLLASTTCTGRTARASSSSSTHATSDDAPGVVLCAWRPRQLSSRVAVAVRAAHPRWTATELSLSH